MSVSYVSGFCNRFIQNNKGWILRYDCPEFQDEWINLSLERPRLKRYKKKLRIYRFGWNGERLSRCRDLWDLKKQHPDIHDWIERYIPRYARIRFSLGDVVWIRAGRPGHLLT